MNQPLKYREPNIAIVYDWLVTKHGGAEIVLKHLLDAFPKATLVSTVHNPRQTTWLKTKKVITSWLNRIPFSYKFYQFLSPLMPLAIESVTLKQFDIVLSVGTFVAKGVITHPNQLHIHYLLSPSRYLKKSGQALYNAKPYLRLPILNQITQGIVHYLRWWDIVAANRADIIVSLSKTIAKAVTEEYGIHVDAIMYPPVQKIEVPKKPLKLPDMSVVIISRLITYKGIAESIRASKKLHCPLIIAGVGPDFARLKKIAKKFTIRPPSESLTSFFSNHNGPGIYFLGRCSEGEKAQLIDSAAVLLMPGIEDFGLSAVEAVMAGKKVVIHAESGAAEVLKNVATVTQIESLTENSLQVGIERAINSGDEFSSRSIPDLSPMAFINQMQKMVYDTWHKYRIGTQT